MPVFDAPPQGVPTHDPHGVFDGRNGDRGEQEPFDRFGPFRRLRLADVNDLNGKRRGSARRRRQGDGPIADLHIGDAFLAPVRRLAFADLGPLAQARDRKFPVPLNRRGADAVEQLLRFRQLPAMLGAHQNVDIAETPLLGEHFEEVRFPVHHADQLRTFEPPGRLGAFAQPSQPPRRLAFFRQLVLARPRRVELELQQTQRQAGIVHRHRRVQMKPGGLGAVCPITPRSSHCARVAKFRSVPS